MVSRCGLALLVALPLSAPVAAQAACDPSPQSYVFVKPPQPPSQRATGRPIVVGSQDACAEIIDPKAEMLGPISIEVSPIIRRPRGNRPESGPEPLTNAPSPD